MTVDLARRETMHLSFNLTFPALPCSTIYLEAGDISGKYMTETSVRSAKDGIVHKYTLDRMGRRLSAKEVTNRGRLPNGLPFLMGLINEEEVHQIHDELRRHEGCNIDGWLELTRVASNVILGVKEEALMAVRDGGNDKQKEDHAADTNIKDKDKDKNDVATLLLKRHIEIGLDGLHPDATALNSSHIIHRFRLGPSFPDQQHPLEGIQRIDRKATGVDKYFVKVVPTDYFSIWGRRLHTSQLSVTEYYHPIVDGERVMPGVYFMIDMWPMKVVLREKRLGVLKLGVRICAVVGGALAVTRLGHKLLDAAVEMKKRR
jgi:hypothetical protein